MSTLDFLWYVASAICIFYIGTYLIDAGILCIRKKNYEMVTAKVSSCSMEKKWAYTAMNIKYEYAVNGSLQKGFASVKFLLKPTLHQGSDVHIYYDPNDLKENFPGEQIKADLRNTGILLVLGAGLVLTIVLGL